MPAGEYTQLQYFPNIDCIVATYHSMVNKLIPGLMNKVNRVTYYISSLGESEARAKTRARFDEVFKKYTDPATSEKKKVKKKKSPDQPEQESIVVRWNRSDQEGLALKSL